VLDFARGQDWGKLIQQQPSLKWRWSLAMRKSLRKCYISSEARRNLMQPQTLAPAV